MRDRLPYAAAFVIVSLVLAPAATASDRALENAVKATFLYKFASFVDWPAGSFGSESAPFELCLVGADPYGGRIDEAVSGQRVGRRPIVLRRLERADRDSRCHAMLISGSSSQSVEGALQAVAGTPVLTITDSELDSAAGIIHFVIVRDRVSFDIDNVAAARNSLGVSSKLLALARNVRTGGAR